MTGLSLSVSRHFGPGLCLDYRELGMLTLLSDSWGRLLGLLLELTLSIAGGTEPLRRGWQEVFWASCGPVRPTLNWPLSMCPLETPVSRYDHVYALPIRRLPTLSLEGPSLREALGAEMGREERAEMIRPPERATLPCAPGHCQASS